MIYGQRALGVSDSMLLQQRCSSASCTCVSAAGANLDLTLLIADGKSRGAADPAFEAHTGVVYFGALAIWEHWAPRVVMEYVLKDAKVRLVQVKIIWNAVFGPAAALVATLKRLQWEMLSATDFCTDDAVRVNLKVDSPACVVGLVSDSVARWRWRRIADKLPALNVDGFGVGAEWGPVASVLNCKDSEQWGPEHKGALKSLIMGRQWTQQRRHKAFKEETDLCQLCLNHPLGYKKGNLIHRHTCPELEPVRRRYMPSWLEPFARQPHDSMHPSIVLALTRGLWPTKSS